MKIAVVGIAAVLTACSMCYSDVVTHFGDGVGPGIGDFLDQVMIGRDNAASENAATRFTMPGAPGTPTDFQFTFEGDFGGFEFVFGYSRIAANPFDPATQRLQWATHALSAENAVMIFDDRSDDPGESSPILTETAGELLAFFIIPNNTLEAFRADPAAFYADDTGLGNGSDILRSPLFSVTEANPGDRDQMLSFAANGVTMFAFEDLIRTAGSDESFTDLVFTVDTEIVPTPAGALLLFPLLARRRRRS